MSIPLHANPAEAPFGPQRTPYEAIGGEPAVRALVDRFYDLMDQAPEFSGIRSLHRPSLHDARQKLFEFLCGWLGGPQLYVQNHGHPRLRARHMPFPIGDSQRDQWIACMNLAMDQQQITGPLRTFLNSRFKHVADFMRNQEPV